jgi:hypothetical protein
MMDGLFFYGNSLIAIQTEQKRINRDVLDAGRKRVERAEVLESYIPLFDEPTTGVIVGDALYYIANSHNDLFDRDGKIFPPEKLRDVIILRVEIPPP